tara:strand:+ start:251 stop:682 length:432 start_codon:yes stop_codon:yes gene_type:complete
MAVLEGTAYWAFVTSPNTTYDPVYTVNLVVDNETASDFEDRGFTVKQMDEGPAVVIKRKVNGPNGMIRKAPQLLNRNLEPVDVNVGNGSKVKVKYKEWESTWNGKQFKGLDFIKMQIIDLVEYNPDGQEDELTAIEEEELDDL